jgi:dihydrolipoamide dehydrogenase
MGASEMFDLVVIGGGPAGYVGALRAAQLGASVAAIEQDKWGGTCLNRGCIPSKALLHAAEALEVARQAANYGINFGAAQIDWEGIRQFKTRAVRQLGTGVEQLLKSNKVRQICGRARLVGDREVEVRQADGTTLRLRGRRVLLATGSVPWVPPLPGLDAPNVFTSDEAVDLPGPLESLIIVGAGAVGCEFAYIYAQLGTKVTLVEMMPQIIPTEDSDLAEVLAKALTRAGVRIVTEAKVIGVQEHEGRKHIECERAGKCERLEAEAILVAVGRRAAICDLGLEEAGVQTERTGIKINERLETTAEGVYAAGDCVRGLGLAHLSSHEAIAAVENAFGQGGQVRYDCVPACIFTHPEVASVGLKEKQAREQGREIIVGRFPFSANSRAAAVRERVGLVKLIAAAPSRQLIGAAIVGPAAAELIAVPALAITLGATLDEVAETIHAHPTFAEALHEAALAGLGRALHLPPSQA